MIKGTGNRNGTPVLLLGLTKENTTRLHDDKPILISAKEMIEMGFPPMEIAIVAGETEASISKALGGLPLQPEVPGQVFTQKVDLHLKRD